MAEVENRESRSRVAFTADSLPKAIGNLFEMNHYDVRYDIHVHGAQIDLAVTAKGDPFAVPIYIEATVEYVSNDKYAKDSTKFLLIRNREPGAKLLCISSTGFTAGVKERARESGVEALTYTELFSKFEKFTPYLDYVQTNKDINSLIASYEEPLFNDEKGIDSATVWLNRWRSFAPDDAKWLIILGEYGTGKTSLTRVLQHRWLGDYLANPASPIPIRIELRNFTRQFDANGLLHHFLDTNRLSHVPIEFMTHLIKTGRVILLLDGYDEMAQFLNSRERRACLNALAELASNGAKGILTSRPNYFTESEELNVFEALYRSLEQNAYHLSGIDRAFIATEKSVDDLIERYILNKYERALQDLNPEQTKSLVKRKLSKDEDGQRIVLSILDRVFREEVDGTKQALSGKPVIISYLLELVNDLRAEAKQGKLDQLSEWQVYKLIVDKLMLRDLHRTGMDPTLRRRALQSVAMSISTRDRLVADEGVFMEIIDTEFVRELKPLQAEDRRSRRIEIFEDLRSSATLTRAYSGKDDGWVFSHNSLREFLVAEKMLTTLIARNPIGTTVPITPAMRTFVASIAGDQLKELWVCLAELWPRRTSDLNLGPHVNLLWDAAHKLPGGVVNVLGNVGGRAEDGIVEFSNLNLRDISFAVSAVRDIQLDARDAALSDCDLSNINWSGSIFKDTILDNVSFENSVLKRCDFRGAFIFECDFSGVDVDGADFRGIDPDCSILLDDGNGQLSSITGYEAIGYLKYRGAFTNDVEDFYVLRNDPRFSIVKKIIEKLNDTKLSQYRGLTQRGANSDPPFARAFVDKLASANWVNVNKNDLVSVTAEGRGEIQKMAKGGYLAPLVTEFIASAH